MTDNLLKKLKIILLQTRVFFAVALNWVLMVKELDRNKFNKRSHMTTGYI